MYYFYEFIEFHLLSLARLDAPGLDLNLSQKLLGEFALFPFLLGLRV